MLGLDSMTSVQPRCNTFKQHEIYLEVDDFRGCIDVELGATTVQISLNDPLITLEFCFADTVCQSCLETYYSFNTKKLTFETSWSPNTQVSIETVISFASQVMPTLSVSGPQVFKSGPKYQQLGQEHLLLSQK